jgi:hypothetical protein
LYLREEIQEKRYEGKINIERERETKSRAFCSLNLIVK